MKLVGYISALLAALDGAIAAGTPPPPPRANPVVLVHGIFSGPRDMTRMAAHLRREGWQVFTPDLQPNGGQAGIDVLAHQLASYIDRNLPSGSFDLVGFSMGGLVSRYYVQRLADPLRIEHLVTLAAPHHGTAMAWLNHGPGGVQMRPGSTLYQELERHSTALSRVKFTSFYTPCDLVILPPRSSVMPQARNIRIWAIMHPSLILEMRSIRAVATALRD